LDGEASHLHLCCSFIHEADVLLPHSCSGGADSADKFCAWACEDTDEPSRGYK
jgi:hypothetical protein